jgi:hypothetical protein
MHGRPLATITHDDLVQLDACFRKLHGPSLRKSPRHRSMTIWEILAETKAEVKAGEEAIAKASRRRSKANDPTGTGVPAAAHRLVCRPSPARQARLQRVHHRCPAQSA